MASDIRSKLDSGREGLSRSSKSVKIRFDVECDINNLKTTPDRITGIEVSANIKFAILTTEETFHKYMLEEADSLFNRLSVSLVDGDITQCLIQLQTNVTSLMTKMKNKAEMNEEQKTLFCKLYFGVNKIDDLIYEEEKINLKLEPNTN